MLMQYRKEFLLVLDLLELAPVCLLQLLTWEQKVTVIIAEFNDIIEIAGNLISETMKVFVTIFKMRSQYRDKAGKRWFGRKEKL